MVVRRGIAVVALLVLGACGNGSEGTSPPQPTSPSSTATATAPSPAPEDPTLTAKPPSGGTTLTGVVGAADDDSCLTLSTGGMTWLLVGAVAAVEPGDRVTVRGSPAPDLATRCQQGTPFVVEAVEPG